ncbi:DUF1272 domain-containing protein [Bosea sp. (in: a-proteobacteria)]|uniref:DUF1272 domain-containing protein n=1 Tax=Bosea sp. (in: a-proteobacteria) TaxID=1871050 RepID=UPI002FC5E9BD
MLELRPNCELCDRDLPPASLEARICSYECTYCADCAERVLENVCPSCGGGFVQRPVRPVNDLRGIGLGLANRPASTTRKHSQWTEAQRRELTERLRSVPPQDR